MLDNSGCVFATYKKVRSRKQKTMDVVAHNRIAWNKESAEGGRWCIPHSLETIEAARNGEWEIRLGPNKQVPKGWFGALKGRKVLCLASGGGQQAPLLAAAGASVTSFDNSDEQLAKDKLVADRDSLDLRIVQGDMADLSVFGDESFDLVFHSVSNLFVVDVEPVWCECFRVLRWNGRLLSGFMNPAFFLFNHANAERSGILQVEYSLPFSELTSLSDEERERVTADGEPFEFGHCLDDQIGGQLAAGFLISGFYEDSCHDESMLFNQYSPTYISTLAIKVRIEPDEGGNAERRSSS